MNMTTNHMKPVRAWALIDRHNPDDFTGALKFSEPETKQSDDWFYEPVIVSSTRWLTREAFEANHRGFCWISDGEEVKPANFIKGNYLDVTGLHSFEAEDITHVMPIHPPQAPSKE